MKVYTDIEQSKMLADILPIESADMWWLYITAQGKYIAMMYEEPDPHYLARMESYGIKDAAIRCWSLAALLNLLPNEIITDDRFAECHYQIDIRKYDGDDNTTLYQIAYGNDRGLSGFWHDMVNTGEKENLVDCCVQMILELHKLKML